VTGIRSFYIQAASFAVGVAAAQLCPATLPWTLALPALALSLACLASAALRPVAMLALGVLWALFRADLVLDARWPDALEGRDATVVGTVSGLPEPGARRLVFDLRVRRAWAEDEPIPFAGRIRLRWYEPAGPVAGRVEPGSTWRLRVRLKQPHGYSNPGGFDYEAYLFRERIRATGYVRESPQNRRLQPATGWSLQAYRGVLRGRLDAAAENLRFAGMLRALALGDRSGISEAQWHVLRDTGTNHLIAISGLHVGFAAGIGALLGLWTGRVLTLWRRTIAAPRSGALAALLLALAYAALSGFAIPAQRAFVMAAVFLAALLYRRHAWSGRGLCLALVLVLVLQPASVHDPGLWLSFAAVALILAWLNAGGVRSDRSAVIEAVKLQWVVSLGLLPVVAGFFGRVALVAAPANMIAVPAVMFGVVPMCLAAVGAALAGWEPVVAACLAVADTVLGWLWPVLVWLARQPGAGLPVHLALWQSIALLAGVLWVFLAPGRTRRWAAVCLLVLAVPGPSPPAPGGFRVTVLDVGQGLSVVVRTAGHVLVYDTGPRYPSGFNLAEAAVLPYLRERGIDRVDLLVISHGDNDHRGGFEPLVAGIPVDGVMSSVAHRLPGAHFCLRGQAWRWDGVTFEVLHPRRARPPPHNNASCVLRIDSPHGSALLTGDIEREAEAELRRTYGGRLASDVMLVPHQGSHSSSTPAFIDAVSPAWAIASAGYINRYGHPREAVMARYRRRGAATFNTAASGAVTAEVGPAGIRITEHRRRRTRLWLDMPAGGG